MPAPTNFIDRSIDRRRRAVCTARTRKGTQCKRTASRDNPDGTRRARTEAPLCLFHIEQALGLLASRLDQRREDTDGRFSPEGGPMPSPSDNMRGGVTKQTRQLATVLIDEQARQALARLRLEPSPGFDPKSSLLWAVESAHRTMRVWESLMAALPEEDYDQIGVVPIPGNKSSARGTRLEIIARNLAEAQKNSARASKLAIDAGIEERLVRLAEEQSALIADTVRAAAIAVVTTLALQLRLSPKDQAAAQEAAISAAATHLRQLAAGGQDIVEGVARRMDP